MTLSLRNCQQNLAMAAMHQSNWICQNSCRVPSLVARNPICISESICGYFEFSSCHIFAGECTIFWLGFLFIYIGLLCEATNASFSNDKVTQTWCILDCADAIFLFYGESSPNFCEAFAGPKSQFSCAGNPSYFPLGFRLSIFDRHFGSSGYAIIFKTLGNSELNNETNCILRFISIALATFYRIKCVDFIFITAI